MPMQLELDLRDIDTILESLKYSKMYTTHAQGTPYEVRQENLARIEAVEAKIREARRAIDSGG